MHDRRNTLDSSNESVEGVYLGNHQCIWMPSFLMYNSTWIFGIGWEVVALGLALWVTVKHFRELRRSSTAWNTEDYFTVLINSHIFYFIRWDHVLNVIFVCWNSVWTSFTVVSGIEDGLAFEAMVHWFLIAIMISNYSLCPQNMSPAEYLIWYGVFRIVTNLQMFVLGPRLILSIRQYHAKVVANHDEGSRMTTMLFQERATVSIEHSV